MGFPKVEFITVEDAVKVAIDRLELVEPQDKLWLWDEFAQMSFVTDNQFDIGYEQAREDAIELLEKELHRKADRKTEPSGYKTKPVEDEPTISKMEQVETMSCAECIHKPIGAEICEEPCHYAPKDESQTERSNE